MSMMTDEQREALEYALSTLAATQIDNALLHRRCRAIRVVLASAAPAEGREAVDERAAFEAWAMDNGYTDKALQPCTNTRRFYLREATQAAWDAWQARAALATAPIIPAECDVRKILLRVVPGDGDGLEIYAKNVAEVEKLLCEMGERLEDFESRATAPTMSDSHAVAWENPSTHAILRDESPDMGDAPMPTAVNPKAVYPVPVLRQCETSGPTAPPCSASQAAGTH